jgi:D-serine deaminase-like pyridoxal phosphate-dependent protein
MAGGMPSTRGCGEAGSGGRIAVSNDSAVIGWPVQDLDTPALLVDLDALERNIATTVCVIRGAGVNWRPHTKGQKVPAIAHLEVAAGAIGVTCAKLGEAEVMVACGIKSVLIANQIVGAHKAARLANVNRLAEVISAVDSVENVQELDMAGRAKAVRVPVVIEVNTGMDRCGVEPGEPAVALARSIAQCAGLRFMGVMAWEGQARKVKDLAERRVVIEKAVGQLVWSAKLCREAGLPVQIVSCGGTGTEEISSRIPGVTEIQAGGIVFNDMRYAELGTGTEFAMTVLSTVISRPTPTRIVTDAGRKTMSHDQGTPKPKGVEGVNGVSLSAEHGVITLEQPNTKIRIGDKLEWIVGYTDSTVCLHDEMYGVRDGVVEAVWPILGRGKSR